MFLARNIDSDLLDLRREITIAAIPKTCICSFPWRALAASGSLNEPCQVPDLQGPISTPRNQATAVGAERQAHHETGVTPQCVPQFPGRGSRVPKPDGRVLARRGEPPALAVEGHGEDVPGVPAECLLWLARLRGALQDSGVHRRDQIVACHEVHLHRQDAEEQIAVGMTHGAILCGSTEHRS
jgi:hypothetical protein